MSIMFANIQETSCGMSPCCCTCSLQQHKGRRVTRANLVLVSDRVEGPLQEKGGMLGICDAVPLAARACTGACTAAAAAAVGCTLPLPNVS
jgi:hypothetical protein